VRASLRLEVQEGGGESLLSSTEREPQTKARGHGEERNLITAYSGQSVYFLCKEREGKGGKRDSPHKLKEEKEMRLGLQVFFLEGGEKKCITSHGEEEEKPITPRRLKEGEEVQHSPGCGEKGADCTEA